MIRILWLLLFALPCFAGPEDSCVKVCRKDASGNHYGSGTVVQSAGGRSLVLTNWHVVPDGQQQVAVLHGKDWHPAKWVAVDTVTDLSLVRVEATLPVAQLAEREPPVGTVLRRWGFPGGGAMVAKSNKTLGVSNYRMQYPRTDGSYQDGGAIYEVEQVPEKGESGSGLFDPDGRLVAVVWGDIGRPAASCVRLSDVRRFLDRHK